MTSICLRFGGTESGPILNRTRCGTTSNSPSDGRFNIGNPRRVVIAIARETPCPRAIAITTRRGFPILNRPSEGEFDVVPQRVRLRIGPLSVPPNRRHIEVMGEPAFDYHHLSIDERLRLVEDIWDSIAQEANVHADALPLSDAQRAELYRRI